MTIDTDSPISSVQTPTSAVIHEVGLRRPVRVWWLWALMLLAGSAARLAWGYDADELQNLHFAWNIAQGQLPYRDFFEHHPPVFHYALAPFVGGLDRPGWALLIGTRIVALGVAVLVLWAFHRLLLRFVSRQTAALGIGVLLVTHPFGTTIFELRADWFALAALLFALDGLLESMNGSTGRQSLRGAVLAGLLAGLGVVLTQKTALLLAGAGLWAVGCVIAAPRPLRRSRISAIAVFAGAAAVPLLALAGWFAAHGALGALVEHTVLINLRWASEGTWRYTANESLPPILPIAVLAVVGLLVAVRGIGRELRSASPESAAAMLFLTGLASLLTTPVPHGQSYLFLVVPWALLLAMGTLERLVARPDSIRHDRRYYLTAAVVCLLALSPVAAALSAITWSGLLLFALKHTDRPRRLVPAAAILLAIGVVIYFGRAADGLIRHEGTSQAAFIAFVHDRIPTGATVLETWPLVTPFRPQPTFHGFARRGPAQTIGVSRLEAEYQGALSDGRARFAVVDDHDVRRQLPGFGEFLDARCRRVPGAPPTRDRLALYDCGGE